MNGVERMFALMVLGVRHNELSAVDRIYNSKYDRDLASRYAFQAFVMLSVHLSCSTQSIVQK